MGIVGIHPAVFVRVASKGLAGYGTWKSAQRAENKWICKMPFCSEKCGESGKSSRKILGTEMLPFPCFL
jgi:hypothetical protein